MNEVYSDEMKTLRLSCDLMASFHLPRFDCLFIANVLRCCSDHLVRGANTMGDQPSAAD